VGLVGPHVDRLLTQALDETTADRGVFNEESARAVALLDLHHLPFERVKAKLAADHLKNVEDFLAAQQNHTSGVVTGLVLAERDIPTHDNAIIRLTIEVVIGRQPFALDDIATGGKWSLLILRRKGIRAHFALKLGKLFGRFVLGMKELALP